MNPQNILNVMNRTGKKKWENYQGVCYEGKVIIEGKRNMYERFNLLDKNDIIDKTIIDFGCNIGMNCQLSIEAGAKKAVGLEYEDHLVDLAIQINHLFGDRDCEFYQFDLSKPLNLGKFDTGYVFAIEHHVGDNGVLVGNILKNVEKVVYFETHTNKHYRRIPREIENVFSKVEFIGYTEKKKRHLYRCEV